MKIVGCDLHTRYQQIAMLDTETGELTERRLEHANGEARAFYAGLQGAGARGHRGHRSHPLVRAHAGRAGTRAVDRRCGADPGLDGAQAEDRRARRGPSAAAAGGRPLPAHLAADLAERDLRQLVWHRQKLVWMRNAVGNQLHALAMGEGVCRKKQLWTKKGRAELEGLRLGDWASYRRQELLTLLDQLDSSLAKLDRAVEEQSQQNQAAVLLRTHPGVGPVTSLAFVLTLGPVERFARSKQVVSYLGLNPREHSSAGGPPRLLLAGWGLFFTSTERRAPPSPEPEGRHLCEPCDLRPR